MSRVVIVGIGPGNLKYLPPIAFEAIEKCKVVIGGKRHLSQLDIKDKEVYPITSDLKRVVEIIKHHIGQKVDVCVLASGDPGLFGVMSYLLKHLSKQKIEVIPGISSMQYMFARMKIPWHDVYITSFHGREIDLKKLLKHHSKIALFTDTKNSPNKIARELVKLGLENIKICVGENLSYPNERIVEGYPREIAEMDDFKMSVMVIQNETKNF